MYSFNNQTTSKVAEKKTEIQSTKTVNMTPVADNNGFGFQVTYPSDYFATVDQMLVDYGSQGGSAPPRLILMKNFQVTDGDNFYSQIADPANTCISIWTTMSFDSIDDWYNAQIFTRPELKNKAQLAIGSRKADVYEAKSDKGDILVGFLPLGDAQSTSYYFQTCNNSNRADFESVLKSLKLRSDLNL